MPAGQPVRVQQVVGHQDFRVVLQVTGDDVQHSLGVGDLLLALAPGPLAGHPVIVAEQLGGLIEQRHVRWGPAALGFPAEQVPLGRAQPGRGRGQPAR